MLYKFKNIFANFYKFSKKLKKRAFTLVELIVVIVILAVLAALAFMMVSKWIGSSKDSRRKTDLAVVSNGMSLYIADHIIYPDPDNMKPVKDSVGGTGWYQGELGDTVKDFISGLKKTPKDPSGENYGYSITTDKKKYQLRAITENQEKIGYIGDNLYAATYYGYIKGNYDGYVIILTGGTYNFYQIPSLFINDTDLTESYRLSTGLQPIIQNNKPITDKFDVKKVDVSTMFNGGDYTSALNLITTTMTGYGSIDQQTAYRIVKEAPGTNPTLFSATPPAADPLAGPAAQVPPSIGTVTNFYFSTSVAVNELLSGFATPTNGDAFTGYELSGTMPAGLSLNASTGIISGTPTTVGESTLKLRIGDNDGWSAWSAPFIMDVGVCGDGQVGDGETCDFGAGNQVSNACTNTCSVSTTCLDGSNTTTCPVCTFDKTSIGYCKFGS